MRLSPGCRFPDCSLLRVVSLSTQRACYLSINPQKDEALETEKVQYTLPDGSTLDVSCASLALGSGHHTGTWMKKRPVCLDLVFQRWDQRGSGPQNCCSSRT